MRLTEAEYAELMAKRRKPQERVSEVPKQIGKSGESKIERRLSQQLAEHPEIPAAQRNYFFLPDRDLELDYAWPALRVGVEIQGQAHRIKGKFRRDIEKRALAMLAGWRVLELDGHSIRSGRGLEWLKALLGQVGALPGLANPAGLPPQR